MRTLKNPPDEDGNRRSWDRDSGGSPQPSISGVWSTRSNTYAQLGGRGDSWLVLWYNFELCSWWCGLQAYFPNLLGKPMGHPHPWNKLATGGSYCLQLKNPDGGSFHPEVKWPRNIKPQKKTFLKFKVRASKPADQQSKNEQECSPTQAKPCCTANIFF